jgi:hypothetical protein
MHMQHVDKENGVTKITPKKPKKENKKVCLASSSSSSSNYADQTTAPFPHFSLPIPSS